MNTQLYDGVYRPIRDEYLRDEVDCMKKLLIAGHIILLFVCTAVADDLQGVVIKVTGDSVTVEVVKQLAKKVHVDDLVKLTVHERPPDNIPTLDMLYG